MAEAEKTEKKAIYKATRDGYGEALVQLGELHEDIVVLDADLSESTRTHLFAKKFGHRFFNVGVAEQNLVGMAAGFALSGLTPFASSFAMFLSGRAWEIVRNSVAYPRLNVKLVASHAGLTVGEDGASHQCLEDIAVMRVLPGMHIFVPADFEETKQIIQRAYEIEGPCYVRCGRAALPLLKHADNYSFQEGKGELRRDGKDLVIIACGTMVCEAEQAALLLEKESIDAAVINMASIKPIDEELIVRYACQTGAVLSVEEHNIIGGLGSAISEVLTQQQPVWLSRLGTEDRWGQSGSADALLDHYGLRAKKIAEAAHKLLQKKEQARPLPR